jgi:hypothetical protein
MPTLLPLHGLPPAIASVVTVRDCTKLHISSSSASFSFTRNSSTSIG